MKNMNTAKPDDVVGFNTIDFDDGTRMIGFVTRDAAEEIYKALKKNEGMTWRDFEVFIQWQTEKALRNIFEHVNIAVKEVRA